MASVTLSPAPTPAHELRSDSHLSAEPPPPILRSSQGSPFTSGWMLPTPRDTPITEMRARYDRDGYIWVKNVMSRDVVLDMREHYFYHLTTHLPPTVPFLSPSAPSPRLGIFNPSLDPFAHEGIGGTPTDEVSRLLDEIHAGEVYRRFLKNRELRAFVRELMGWEEEILVERAMLRHSVPGGRGTGVHYDAYFLRASPSPFLTAWLPLGDTAPNGGGLMYLSNSNALGQKLETDFLSKAAHLSPEERISAFNVYMNQDGFMSHDAGEFAKQYCCEDGEEGVAGGKGEKKAKWLVGDYEAGDVVFHKPHMIHAATKNEDVGGRIRLASDLRFYEAGKGIDERWKEVWRHDDGL